MDITLETARLKASQRRHIDLKNAILAGQSVPTEAIAPAWARVARAVMAAVMAAPGKIRFRLPTLSPYDESIIEEVLRDQLSDAGMGLEPPKLDVADLDIEVEDAAISDK